MGVLHSRKSEDVAGSRGQFARARQAIRRRPSAWIASVYLFGLVLACVGAPWLAPYGPEASDLLHPLQGPSAAHLLGTDDLGRDVLSRLLYGGRVTLLSSAEAVVIFVAIGLPLGLFAGYYGRHVDRLIMSATDVVLSIPVIIVLLVVGALFHGDLPLMVTLGVVASPAIIRVVRASTLAVRDELYVKAAQVAGLSRCQILTRHILPQVLAPALVQISVFAAGAIIIESSLGFLGLDTNPPAPSWGSMIAEAATVIDQQSWLIVPSGIAIALTVMAVGVLGDALRDGTNDKHSSRPSRGRRGRTSDVVKPAVAACEENLDALLSVRDLVVSVTGDGEDQVLIDGVSFDVAPGESLGLIGESGSGKSLTVLAVLGLLPDGIKVTGGSVWFEGRDLVRIPLAARRALLGREMGLISQEPMSALDPGHTIGRQLADVLRANGMRSRSKIRQRSLELLAAAELPDPKGVAARFAHELSGGMAQRVCIALALAGAPKLLFADEPTTALDVTVQAEILQLLRSLRENHGMALVLVTHDWGVVADACDHAIVMYAGQVFEHARLDAIFRHPLHPYTEGLLEANPHFGAGEELDRDSLPFRSIPGVVPAPRDWPSGCRFAPRCRYSESDCVAAPVPLFVHKDTGRSFRCLHPEQIGTVLSDAHA